MTSNNITVTAWEVRLVDPTRNHLKFYRFYLLPGSRWVAQYGRVGAVGKITLMTTGHAAADRKTDTELAKGYLPHGGLTTFTITPDLLNNIGGMLEELHVKFLAVANVAIQNPTEDDDEVDDSAILATLASLQTMLAEPAPAPASRPLSRRGRGVLPTPATTNGSLTPAMTGMEQKLADALAKAKGAK